MHPSKRIDHIRGLLSHRGDIEYDREIARHLDELQGEIDEILAIARRSDTIPATASVTVQAAGVPTTLEGTTMANAQFPLGTKLKYTADVRNAEGIALPLDAVTWATDAGTGTVDPADGHVFTVVNAPFGTVTVTMTTSNGVVVVTSVDIVDNTPATATVTVAAA